MATVSVRIFASHPVAVTDYTRLLASQQDFCLVSNEDPFQVGVFDGELASLDAMLTMARLKFSSMRPLLLWSSSDENECLRWLFRGVWGLVTYESYEDELPRAVRHLAEGQLWFPAPVVVRWMHIEEERRTATLHHPLTPREHEVMEFLLRRLSNKEIAGILHIRESTVKFHVTNIFNKLHVSSRQELSAAWVPHLRQT